MHILEILRNKVHTLSLAFNRSPSNDYDLCKEREIPVTADDLFHHNGSDFDLKKYNSRLIYHSHGPLPPILCIDRLKEARKIAKFSSNRLDYLGTHLGLRAKIETGSQELWDII